MSDRDHKRSRTGDAANTAASPRAFTLLEVVVVITILAVFAVLAIPRVAGASDRSKLTAAERQIRATIEQAERTAFRRGEVVRVTVVPSLHELRVQTGGETQTLRLGDRPYEVQFEAAAFGIANTFDFDPAQGQRPSGSITLRRGGFQRVVSFTPMTALLSAELVDLDLLPGLELTGAGGSIDDGTGTLHGAGAGKGGLGTGKTGGGGAGGYSLTPSGLD
mgnify:CR=1 FL=1